MSVKRIKRVTKADVWESYVHINQKKIYLGQFENKRLAELMSLMWQPEIKNRKSDCFTEEQLKTAEANGIEYSTLYRRVFKYKWDIEKAITKPVNPKIQYTRKVNNLKNCPAYDAVMNYLIKRYVENKKQLQKLFPQYDPKIIELAWESGKELDLC